MSATPEFGIVGVDVRSFRSARDVSFAPAPMCALVGEASAGKSNLLAAIRAVLDPAGAPLAASDLPEDSDRGVSIRLRLADGSEATLEGTPERCALIAPPSAPPILFLSADARASAVTSSSVRATAATRALEIFGSALSRDGT